MHGEARRLPDRPTIGVAAEDAIESLYTIVIGQHVEQCIAGTSNEEVGKRKLRELLAVSQRYVE